MNSNERQVTVLKKGPDLNVPPHVLHLLMELFFDKAQEALLQKEQLLTHLAQCHYCRTALETLLSIVSDFDQKEDASNKRSQELLEYFQQLRREFDTYEAHRLERLGAYAEIVAAHGKEQADTRFPELAVHLKLCSDCRSLVDSTVSMLKSENGMGKNAPNDES